MENLDVTSFGKLILEKRKNKNYTLKELANETEKYGFRISESYLNRLENGKRKEPSFQVVITLIKALELTAKEVFESLKVGQVYNEILEIKQEIFLPDDLDDYDVTVGIHEEFITMSHAQKELLKELIGSLYGSVLYADSKIDFEEYAISAPAKLAEILHEDFYVIKYKGEDFELCFNVEVMVEKYNLKKDDIKSALDLLNIKSIYSSDYTIPLPIKNEVWVTKRVENTIIFIDKISETLKSYLDS